MWSEKVKQDAALLLTENHHGPRNLPTPYSTTRMKGRQQSKALRNMSQISIMQTRLDFFCVHFPFSPSLKHVNSPLTLSRESEQKGGGQKQQAMRRGEGTKCVPSSLLAFAAPWHCFSHPQTSKYDS